MSWGFVEQNPIRCSRSLSHRTKRTSSTRVMLKTVAMASVSARKLDLVSGSLESFGITLDAIKTAVVSRPGAAGRSCICRSQRYVGLADRNRRFGQPNICGSYPPSPKLRNGSGFDENMTKTPGLIAGRSFEATVCNLGVL